MHLPLSSENYFRIQIRVFNNLVNNFNQSNQTSNKPRLAGKAKIVRMARSEGVASVQGLHVFIFIRVLL